MKDTKEIQGILQFDGDLSIDSVNNVLADNFKLEQPQFFEQEQLKMFKFRIGDNYTTLYVGVVFEKTKDAAKDAVNQATYNSEYDVFLEEVRVISGKTICWDTEE